MVAQCVASVPPKQWTYSELPEWNGTRKELHDGVLIERPSPSIRHQMILQQLLIILSTWVRQNKSGRTYLSPVDLHISETRVLIPDLSCVSRERLESERIEREDGACLVAPPDLAVEIISPGSRRHDRIYKLNAYAAFGVRHYWILDPDSNTLEAFVLENGRYTLDAALDGEQNFEPSLFAGLSISLAELFADTPL